MSMSKKIDNAGLNQYTDNAIRRGYEIYDEWIDKKRDSRKIVASAYNAVRIFNKRKTMAAFIEALAHLFALDERIKEKYKSFLGCLFSYFSWRRETRALGTLKAELNIPQVGTSIRDLIAVEIERIAEKLEDGWDEDGDDETHGGKRNGKAEEEIASEKKETEVTEEKKEAEELSDKEETKEKSEEKKETSIEEAQPEEAKAEIDVKTETSEPRQEEAETKATDKREEPVQERKEDPQKDNGVSGVESEPTVGKKTEVKAYNNAVDFVPLSEETVPERSSKQISFLDEMTIDDMVKGDKSIIGYRRIGEERHNKEADPPQDSAVGQNEEKQSSDKDDYLYDEMIAANKGDLQKTNNVEAANSTQTVESEQPKQTVQNNNIVDTDQQEFKPISEMLKTGDPGVDQENSIANEINTSMSLESKMSFVRMKEEQLREHMKITLEELGMEDTSEVLRVSAPDEVSPPSVTQNRK